MTDQIIKQAVHHYHTSCENIAEIFRDKYFGRGADLYNIGNDFDGVWGVSDFYYFNLSDMALALELKVTWKCLEDWYENCLETENTQYNLRNWAKLDKFAKKTQFKTKHENKKNL